MLASTGVKVQKNENSVLPLPDGALFLSRVSKSRLGVEEGDKLVQGFAPLAAKILNGTAIEFENHPDLVSLKEKIESAPAVVFSVGSRIEVNDLLDDIKKVCEMNLKTCFVCQDVPEAAKPAEFAPCIITSYDQTVNAMRAVCDVLKG